MVDIHKTGEGYRMRIKIIIAIAGLIVLLIYRGNQVLFSLGLLAFPIIMYYLIRSAVHDGVYSALIEYDKHKNEEQDI